MRKHLLAAGIVAAALTACSGPPAAPPATLTGSATDLVRPSTRPLPLTPDPRPLAVSYTYQGKQYSLDDFLRRSKTTGFTVLDGQQIVYEKGDPEADHQSWSMAKSFTSTAIGIALNEGRIGSLDDPITEYLPQLRDSGYDGVSIRNLLRMSSGISWNEDQDAPKLQIAAHRGTDLTTIAARQVRGWQPGSRFDYTSLNYFVLGWLIDRVTGMPYFRYIQQKIWQPAGMGSSATIDNDVHGHDLGYCCYHATDRDFARLGLLYLHGGAANGRQVLPRSWVTSATSPSSTFQKNYGLGWWLDGDNYLAAGLGGQYIYVAPKDNVVIVDSADGGAAARSMQPETLTAFRAIADQVAKSR
ncbi:MAG TPA: serine hydrolase [Mycobacteriales bacterium]|nr:serine hydrolase [Mycobacteriales bacterium]